jgi:hypothetical protein
MRKGYNPEDFHSAQAHADRGACLNTEKNVRLQQFLPDQWLNAFSNPD